MPVAPRSRIALALILLVTTACSARPDCGAIDRMVTTTYGFQPATLDSAQRDAKSGAMDTFWNTVRAHPDVTLPCLRSALAGQHDDTFFQFDGSALLVSLDSSRESKAVQLAASDRVDLRGVSLLDWMHVVAARGVDGFNSTAAAARWLTLPDSEAAYYPPQHGGQRISKLEGALFLFGSMPESIATPYLASLVRRTTGSDRELAVWLLVQQATPEARTILAAVPPESVSSEGGAALRAYLQPGPVPATIAKARISRDEFVAAFRALRGNDPAPFEALVSRVPDGEKDAGQVLRIEDLPDVRFARRRYLASITPDALGYQKDFTGLIETVMARARTP